MSKYVETLQSMKVKGDESFVGEEEFAAEFPCTLEVLRGHPKTDDLPGVCPATLMFFIEGGRLKFCISPREGSRVAFGVLDDPTKGLAALELALVKGAFEWKTKRR